MTDNAPAPPGLVYAVGRLEARFPSEGVEREFAQLADSVPVSGLVEVELLRRVLDNPANHYLARHVCWVLSAQHADAFAVIPQESSDVARLAEVLSPSRSDELVHVVVGRTPRGPVDAPCAQFGLPGIFADQVFAFTLDEFAANLPLGDQGEQDPGDMIREIFFRLTRRSANRGVADEHRALNYLAVRYPPIYQLVIDASREGRALIGLDARHSHEGTRRVVSVFLTLKHRRSELTERYRCLVDVTEVFPFMVSGFEPVYD